MNLSAEFPTSLWDGLTENRDRLDDDIIPNQEDFDRISAELRATQAHLLALKDADGAITEVPLVTKGTDPESITWSDLFTWQTKDIIVPGVTAAASFSVGYTIPAGSIVLAAAVNIESLVTLVTATKIGLGISGSLAKYGTVTGGAKNTKSTLSITPTAIATGEVLLLSATDNSNAATGTIATGSIRVRLLIGTQAALPDAA